MISGCASRRSSIDEHASSELDQSEIEARLVDLPLPIHMTMQHVNTDNVSYIIHGTVPLPYNEVTELYRAEMERRGWSTTGDFCGDSLYAGIFEKPHKLCSVTVEMIQESPPLSSLVLSYMYR